MFSFLFLFIFLNILPTRFEENDDVVMLGIASGYYTGEPSEFLVFSNVLIGHLLSTLYTYWPEWPWYSLYLYSFHWLALGLFGLFAIKHLKSPLNFLLITGVVFFEIYSLSYLQFTTTAGMVGLAGALWLWNANKNPFWLNLLGIFAVFTCGIIRSKVLYLVTLLSVPILGYQLYQKNHRPAFFF